MLSSRFLPVWLLAAMIAMLFAPCAFARDGDVITLTLEDPTPASKAAPADAPGAPSPSAPPACAAKPPDVKGAGACLMDVETGQVIWSKNMHTRRANASTTKILTAILLIENCDMADKVKASKKCCETPFTSIHLKPGEEITVRDLLNGMLIRSANDAAVAAAEHIAGSTSKFAAMLNKKAKEIGCANTQFVTPNGLPAKNHYSTAYDLCLMARYAFRYADFNEVIATRKYALDSRTKNRQDLVVFNKSKFLKDYPGADGVKSGYLKQAGYCYVGSATRGGWRLVSAVLKSDNAGRDTAALMDHGFCYFEQVTVARAGDGCAEVEVTGGDREKVPVVLATDLRAVVPKSGASVTKRVSLKPVEAPIRKGAALGTITAVVNGSEVATAELRAAEDVGISFARRMSPWLKTSLFAACLLVGGRYGAALTKNTRRRRRRVTASLRDYRRLR